MNTIFSEILKKLRMEKKISQQQLANILFVDRSTVASWETGRRVPDVTLLARISEYLGIDASELLNSVEEVHEKPRIIVVDDEKIVLAGELSLLEEIIPEAEIKGFTKPSEAFAFAKSHPVSLAFLDIEIGKVNGLDMCKDLLSINQHTNVVFLTAYADYSLNAWDTGASGFLTKPLSAEKIHKQLSLLRYPIKGLI